MDEFSSQFGVRVDGPSEEPEFDLSFGSEGGAAFGADYSLRSELVKKAQAKVNAIGYTPPIKVDGIWGPQTSAAVAWGRLRFNLPAVGGLDDAALRAFGISPTGADMAAVVTDPIRKPSRDVAVATMARALRQAGQELGHPINDTLLRLMLGQMIGAEGSMPGLWQSGGLTFRGTNNIGAAQVPGGAAGQAFAAAHRAIAGWGALAHKDTGANGDYIGWYYIAPSPLEAARHWLTGFAGTKAVLQQNPQTPEDYARIMRRAGYFEGAKGDTDDTKIAKYTKSIAAGMPSLATINGPANDPSAVTVDPAQFASIESRHITESLFNRAKSGQTGGAWSFLLPDTWDDFVRNNGVVWFGPMPFMREIASIPASLIGVSPTTLLKTGAWVFGGAIVGGIVGFGPIGALLGALTGGALSLYTSRKG
jgi:hypothetical protein